MLDTWVTEVSSTAARLRAQVNPEGLSTTYRFEYLTEAAYEANLNAIPPKEGFFGAAKAPLSGAAPIGAGSVAVAVVQPLSSLAPLTAYRFRVVATNSAGTAVGIERLLRTQAASNLVKPLDARAFELVSPPDKGGGSIAAPESLFGGGDLQAAAAGGAVTYGSATSFGQGAGAPPVSQYLSRRGPAGWSTQNVSAPLAAGAYGDQPDGAPYRIFSADLSAGLLFGGEDMAYYLRDSESGAFASLLDAADLAHTTVSPQNLEISLAAASPDLSHDVLSSCAKLTANASEVLTGPGECDEAEQNLYMWSAGTLTLLNLLPGETTGSPGAAMAAPIGALSENGVRAYFTQGGDLYLRDGAQSFQVDEAQGGGGAFQAASADGSVAFFGKEVSAGDVHLYRYATATHAAGDLTPSGGVKGVLGVSADGAYAYFQDAAALRQWHNGVTTQVAAGSNVAKASDYPPSTATARLSAAGAHLAFLSSAAIPPFDNTDAASGVPDTELYLWGPPLGGGPAELVCASCNPTGERPQGSASIPGAPQNGSSALYRPRALSEDGSRVFFDSADRLAIADTDNRPDVYEWEARGAGDCVVSPGCLGLVSSGRSTDGASFVDASADGTDVYFLTGESLVSDDPGSVDLYDARAGGGFPAPPVRPIACIGDACQALPAAPDDPTPGTLTKGSGNPPPRYFRPHRKKPKKHRKRRGRRGKHAQKEGGRKAGRGGRR